MYTLEPFTCVVFCFVFQKIVYLKACTFTMFPRDAVWDGTKLLAPKSQEGHGGREGGCVRKGTDLAAALFLNQGAA